MAFLPDPFTPPVPENARNAEDFMRGAREGSVVTRGGRPAPRIKSIELNRCPRANSLWGWDRGACTGGAGSEPWTAGDGPVRKAPECSAGSGRMTGRTPQAAPARTARAGPPFRHPTRCQAERGHELSHPFGPSSRWGWGRTGAVGIMWPRPQTGQRSNSRSRGTTANISVIDGRRRSAPGSSS
jgi:hypothetical protein